ncbi:yjeF C-terminal region, hydroxyethylthiazole kinase-related/yjeF N-terminal region [Raineyella antarctica]|uniref:ADP-dependent (S)-NAD(P)H-hydrate dehydratase n=1 Tax=Raineyella antarctica TaxID=1577474 RepID=A0A1G6I0H3_9ACTN|nr:bifunctional ADP-dependent NAD(P)H-hydrate dehydratase/NAD(P)H-hydrate epimerase [Raineyella antarctica]SDC00059.1 yjeF C-terminal region, hydroxyethylthiazole kinase-related/yjeF N-terminal region [Raineyella antarctica]
MQLVHNVASIRAAEEEAFARTAEGELMERASDALATSLLRDLGHTDGTCLLVLAGPGDNGGDALWAAARLAGRGVRVWAHQVVEGSVHQAAWQACIGAGAVPVDLEAALQLVERADRVVDGVYGIGGRPGLSGGAAALAEACERTGTPVTSVDIPSGLAADEAGDHTSFRAERTVTFGCAKPCQVMQPAADRCGQVDVVDIDLHWGALAELGEPLIRRWEAADVAAHWPVPTVRSDKYSRGVVGIDAGSATYPGAGVLVAHGAAYAGCGMVRSLGSPEVARAVVQAIPSVVTAPGRVQAWVVGSGWGDRRDGAARLAEVLEDDVPVLVDADALRHVDGVTLRPDCLLTPHAGELAGMLGVQRSEVEAHPIEHVRMAADRTQATVLLKGATQYVATPGQWSVDVAVPGPGWTAQAGSGDTLAGVCGALLAGGLPAAEAAMAAASLQALTAAAEPPLPPHALAMRFGDTLRRLLPGR